MKSFIQNLKSISESENTQTAIIFILQFSIFIYSSFDPGTNSCSLGFHYIRPTEDKSAKCESNKNHCNLFDKTQLTCIKCRNGYTLYHDDETGDYCRPSSDPIFIIIVIMIITPSLLYFLSRYRKLKCKETTIEDNEEWQEIQSNMSNTTGYTYGGTH